MVNTIPFYRMYLNERLRKFLGINLRNKKIYVFKLHHQTYLSVDTIPKSTKCEQLTVRLGNRAWFINIPTTYLEYEPVSYKLLNTRGRVIHLTSSEK